MLANSFLKLPEFRKLLRLARRDANGSNPTNTYMGDVDTMQCGIFDSVKKINELQRKIFVLLEPLLGREEAAVALGSLVAKYAERAHRKDSEVDKDNDIHR